MKITSEVKEQIVSAMLAQRANFDGTDTAYSRQLGIHVSVYNRIKNGEREEVLSSVKWLNLARELDVRIGSRKWNTVETDVFKSVEEEILFCKENGKGRMLVDDCGIGKTYTARYLSRTLKNCFYVDGSQFKKESELIRGIGKAIGVGDKGKLSEIRANTKYYLRSLDHPVVIIDEAGDLTYTAFMLIKEYWNATEFACGWVMMGADGLKKKMELRISSKTVGYAEMFSRFSERYRKITPSISAERTEFYRKLISDVLRPNVTNPEELIEAKGRKVRKLDWLVSQCLTVDETGRIGGLRRAESLAILNG
ncbi:MAG: ATP-binding protein [Bacteroidales bacterium]|jgi:hypothetical protein|nr:ATP-binding protein [Bacteroidales bacterium]